MRSVTIRRLWGPAAVRPRSWAAASPLHAHAPQADSTAPPIRLHKRCGRPRSPCACGRPAAVQVPLVYALARRARQRGLPSAWFALGHLIIRLASICCGSFSQVASRSCQSHHASLSLRGAGRPQSPHPTEGVHVCAHVSSFFARPRPLLAPVLAASRSSAWEAPLQLPPSILGAKAAAAAACMRLHAAPPPLSAQAPTLHRGRLLLPTSRPLVSCIAARITKPLHLSSPHRAHPSSHPLVRHQ
jgi:hypothetical protein